MDCLDMLTLSHVEAHGLQEPTGSSSSRSFQKSQANTGQGEQGGEGEARDAPLDKAFISSQGSRCRFWFIEYCVFQGNKKVQV